LNSDINLSCVDHSKVQFFLFSELVVELYLDSFVVDLILASYDLSLTLEVIFAERHLHEEFLGNLAISCKIWKHFILVHAWHLSLRVSQHLPCIYNMTIRNARLFSNLFNRFLHIFTCLYRAIL